MASAESRPVRPCEAKADHNPLSRKAPAFIPGVVIRSGTRTVKTAMFRMLLPASRPSTDRIFPEPADAHAADLIAVAIRQDRAAFVRLFEHFASRLKGYMLKLGMPPQRAEDLAQETMMTIWRKAALFDPAKAEVATWVFTIARNLRIDALRRERHPEVSDDALLDGNQRAIRLRRVLKTLTPEQAEVVRLSFFADLAHPAIAERLDLPLGTVKSRLRLAMGKIRKALGDDEP